MSVFPAPAADPDLDRCEGGCRCPRCDRDDANLLSGHHHCWDCEDEVRELFESEGVDHV